MVGKRYQKEAEDKIFFIRVLIDIYLEDKLDKEGNLGC